MSKRKINSEPATTYHVEPAAQEQKPRVRKWNNRILAQAIAYIDSQITAKESITDPRIAGDYFKVRLHGKPEECFAALFLNCSHNLIAYKELFQGGIDGAEIHPRVVVRHCIELGATAVIFGHNHPSGNPQPSSADRAVTARLKQALALIDVRTLDHFVIGDGAPTSMAELGLL